MCDRALADVVVAPGVCARYVAAWCDPCLAPLVRALNRGGMSTVASCCGHGERLGSIALEDGRQLVVVPDLEALSRLSALPTLIAGADAPEGMHDA